MCKDNEDAQLANTDFSSDICKYTIEKMHRLPNKYKN